MGRDRGQMGTDAEKAVNIILQHWTGELGEIEKLSSVNIRQYAEKVGAEYRLLRGDVFRPGMVPQCQKLFMLDASLDEYETVVMLDMDIFVRRGMDENIFNAEGVGLRELMQWGLAKKLHHMFPKLGNRKYSYWGGAVYKLNLDMRRHLRQHIREHEIIQFNEMFHDEGIMHRLAVLAKVKGHYFADDRWSFAYGENIEDAAFIHLRSRRLIDGNKVFVGKIPHYRSLVGKGLIGE